MTADVRYPGRVRGIPRSALGPRRVTLRLDVEPAYVRRERVADEPPDDGLRRLPLTRGECAGGPRPCPLVSCRHHVYLDATKNGGVRLNFPDREVWELAETCSLDVADRGPHLDEEVGPLLNLTRERVRQIGEEARRRLERNRVLRSLADGPAEPDGLPWPDHGE